MFCFHAAGGSPDSFHQWISDLPAEIEVHAFAYSHTLTPADYIQYVVNEILEHAEEPYVLFGHSAGSVFAFRVAEAIPKEKRPKLLIVAAPPLTPEGKPNHSWMNDSLTDPAHVMALISGGEHSAQDLPAETVASFAADVRFANATFAALPPPSVLDIPILAFAGGKDPVATPDSLEVWRRYTKSSFEINVCEGGHFNLFDKQDKRPIIDILKMRLAFGEGD
jgi:surfactin synthase thioesterase subunit